MARTSIAATILLFVRTGWMPALAIAGPDTLLIIEPSQENHLQKDFTPVALPQVLKPINNPKEVKFWMGPGDPMVSTGTMTNSWQLGGLYLHQDYVGDKIDGPLPSFEGKGYWGYNTTSNRYEGYWIDNASTTMQMEFGDVDSDGRVWTMNSEVTCPQTGVAMKKRNVITLIDDDHNKVESYFTGEDGNEMKSMEISYTRI